MDCPSLYHIQQFYHVVVRVFPGEDSALGDFSFSQEKIILQFIPKVEN